MANARTVWNAKVETRVAATSNILAQLKSIKAMGLTDAAAALLQHHRIEEIETSMMERNSRIMNFGICKLSKCRASCYCRLLTIRQMPLALP